MSCDECRELQTHRFRSADDLVHAFQVAAQESERGVLRRIDVARLTAAEQQALDSAFASDAMPAALRYRFECTQCGDRFELCADVDAGTGSWTRQEA
jgi:hypothetical protein